MSNSVKGLTVVFKEDLLEEYTDKLIKAIKLFDGVIEVNKSITNSNDYINRSQIEYDFKNKLFNFIKDVK